MKSHTKYFSLLLMVVLTAAACKKEENKIYFEGKEAPVLSSTSNTIALSKPDSSKTAVILEWTNPEYKFTTGVSSHNVSYNLEIDTEGASFGSSVKQVVAEGSNVTTRYTVAEFNDILLTKLKLTAGQPHDVEMRITANIDNVAATKLVSNVLKFTVTPYATVIPIFYLYVPGSHQGWSPSTAPKVGSYNTDSYEGYVYFPDAKTDFKFTSENTWNGTNYGDGGAGKLSSAGSAGNLHIDGSGYYKLNPSTKDLTWTYTKTTWGIIGSATAGQWDNSTPMTFDPATKTWVINSIALTAAEFKFRANNAWDINFGDDPNSDYMKYNGDNFKVTAAGNYKVVLNLSDAPRYTFTITKL
jgi:hypothetical protein